MAFVRRRAPLIACLLGVAIGGAVGCVGVGGPDASSRAAANELAGQIEALESSVASGEGGAVSRGDLRLFARVFDRVKADYVHEVEDEQLIDYAVQGLRDAAVRWEEGEASPGMPRERGLVYAATHSMLTKLDPYSDFLEREQYKSLREEIRGRFGGLGIEITKRDGLLRVVSPIEGTPAEAAGILSGDVIAYADGVEIEPLSLRDAVKLLRGDPGTDVRLTILRGETETLDITVTREIIAVVSVRSRLEGDVGYVRINTFSQTTGDDLLSAIADLKAESGGNMKGLVLDLRNNPGGVLEQSVSVSDAFLDEGLVLFTKTRSGGQQFFSRKGDALNGAPVIVLINGGSASASEIVAGAMQDRGRATLLGEKSFGKGSVQTIFPLDSGRGMKLTTALYYTPSGRSVEGGIGPDVVVADDPDTEEDEQLQEALKMAVDLAGGPSIFWNSGSVRQ